MTGARGTRRRKQMHTEFWWGKPKGQNATWKTEAPKRKWENKVQKMS